MNKLPVAVQLYSVRDEAQQNLKDTLRQIKAMGYDGVELAGLYGHSPEEIRDYMRETGLNPISAHVPLGELVADMEATIDKYIAIGCQYIAIPYLTEEERPGTEKFREVVANIEKIGEICKGKGVTLLYHNHEFEFVKMEDGQYALDYLYETVSADKLQTEIDTCWVKVAGVSPVEYIEKYTNRCPLVHLKDFTGEKSENMYELIGIEGEDHQKVKPFEFRAVGHGVQDFPAILRAAVNSGAKWVIVEQDSHSDHTPMEDIQLSREYLVSLGW